MKKSFITLLCLLCGTIVLAQNSFIVYENNGKCHVFDPSRVDSILFFEVPADYSLDNQLLVQTNETTNVGNYKAVISGNVSGKIDVTATISCGFKYSKDISAIETGNNITTTLSSNGTFEGTFTNLEDGTCYYYTAFVKIGNKYYYGEIKSFTTIKNEDSAFNLSQDGKSNCYIISKAGTYKFDISSYVASSAFLLWNENGESDITDVKIQGDYVYFTKSSFISGNAMISIANDAGTIVWSWHIWSTSTPQTIIVNNLKWMDRNLGATSTIPNTSGVYGLSYNPGNPFPFPGPKYSSWSITATPSVPNGWYVAKGYGFYSSPTTPTPANPMQLCTRTDVYGNSQYYRSGYSQCPYGYYLPSAYTFQDLLGYEPHIRNSGVYPADRLYIPCVNGNQASNSYGWYLCSGIYNSIAVDTWTISFSEGVSSKGYCQGAARLPIRCFSY